MNKHFVILPDGSEAKRNSKNRVYSHCVAFRRSYEVALHAAYNPSPAYLDVLRSNYAYHAAYADGSSQWLGRNSWESDAVYADRRARGMADGARAIAGCSNAEDYIAKSIREEVAAVEQSNANGYYKKWRVAGWNSRRDLAEALASKERSNPYNAEVVIIEAQRR